MNRLNLSLLFCAVSASLVPSRVLALPGDLYSSAVDRVVRYTPGGEQSPVSANFTSVEGLAFDSKGNLFAADGGSGTIYKITPAGVKMPFVTDLAFATALAFDNAGNLFVAQFASNQIVKIDPAGAKTVFAAALSFPSGLAFDAAGNLYEADAGSGRVFKFTPAGVKSLFASGFNASNGPFGLAFDPAGNLFVSDTKAGSVFKVTSSGTKTVFASGIGAPKGIAFDSSGNLFVVDAGGNGTPFVILLYTPGGAKSTFITGGFDYIAFEPVLHQLLNVSTRAFVQTDDRTLIAGFILGGNGQAGATILARALGPSLSALGVPDTLQDPTLEIRDGSGALIARNDDWKGSQQAQLQALGVAPSDSHESALITTLPAGSYTAVVRGFNNTTGNALVEVYNLQ